VLAAAAAQGAIFMKEGPPDKHSCNAMTLVSAFENSAAEAE
jgi:hypothetical protein